MSGHVGSTAVDFGRVFTTEGTATVSSPATVRIDDDFAASQTAITVRSADDKFPGRIDVILDVFVHQVLRKQWIDHLIDDEFTNGLIVDSLIMLSRDDDGIDTHWLETVVLDGNLTFGVRT